jgi:hypothetical protein
MRFAVVAAVLVFLALLVCCVGGPLPACSWPASLDEDAGGACSAGRVLVKCVDKLGDLSVCFTDGDTACPGVDPGANCTTPCNPDEYAVMCLVGGAPPGVPTMSLPSSCRAVVDISMEVGGCCPCGG